MSTFRINYNQVINQANTIYELSVNIESDIKRLMDILYRVQISWEGPASKNFQVQLMRLIDDLNQSRYLISSISSTISNVAISIQKEDERQAELAGMFTII